MHCAKKILSIFFPIFLTGSERTNVNDDDDADDNVDNDIDAYVDNVSSNNNNNNLLPSLPPYNRASADRLVGQGRSADSVCHAASGASHFRVVAAAPSPENSAGKTSCIFSPLQQQQLTQIFFDKLFIFQPKYVASHKQFLLHKMKNVFFYFYFFRFRLPTLCGPLKRPAKELTFSCLKCWRPPRPQQLARALSLTRLCRTLRVELGRGGHLRRT